MELIINIIGAACFGHLAADFLTYFEWLPNKPWKCNQCLTFWLSIIPFMFLYDVWGILIASIAAITSELIYKIL